jgi:ElaB/YqjD/DUF883 family membrane-anchored ribosome-binding protein
MGDSGLSEAARQHASSLSQTAVEHAKEITSTAGEYVESARQAVVDQSNQIADRTRGAIEGIIQDQPLLVALAGLAAGAAVAATFPSSQVERATLGEAGRRLTDVASSASERLAETASVAGQRLKTAVVTDTLAHVTRDVAESFGKSGDSDSQSGRTPATSGSAGPPLEPHGSMSQGSQSAISSTTDFTSKTN